MRKVQRFDHSELIYSVLIELLYPRFMLPTSYFHHLIPHHFSMHKYILVSCTQCWRYKAHVMLQGSCDVTRLMWCYRAHVMLQGSCDVTRLMWYYKAHVIQNWQDRSNLKCTSKGPVTCSVCWFLSCLFVLSVTEIPLCKTNLHFPCHFAPIILINHVQFNVWGKLLAWIEREMCIDFAQWYLPNRQGKN